MRISWLMYLAIFVADDGNDAVMWQHSNTELMFD